ncbi:MAG TPA: hypothetical protein VG944_23140 [Fimbriimonas sp.]|nr:hypothetical protein [Fimbriimonas sp.]
MESSAALQVFDCTETWEAVWNAEQPPTKSRVSLRTFREIAHFVGGALSTAGFRLFQNGGTPLLERHCGALRQEILLVPAPNFASRPDLPFAIHVHLSNAELARVRARYWRPASRAPQAVAGGDLGQLVSPSRRLLFYGCMGLETAQLAASLTLEHAIPWLGAFESRTGLKNRLYAEDLALVDHCTALELLLAEFDPYEARRYLRVKMRDVKWESGPIAEPEGFTLLQDRLRPITSYYKLR